MSRCNNGRCAKVCSTGCSVCQFHYCSRECQIADWSVHKITCAARKCDRLRKFIQYYVTNLKSCGRLIDLSSGSFVYPGEKRLVKTDGHLKALDQADSCNHKCVICQAKIGFNELGPNNNDCSMLMGDFKVIAYRCKSCAAQNIRLMPGSYMTLKETKLYLLACIRQFGVCKDIRKLLCSYLKYDPQAYVKKNKSAVDYPARMTAGMMQMAMPSRALFYDGT